MTTRTWLYRLVTTLLISGLAACGGSGGGGGSASIPTATNASIAPPPSGSVAITNSGGPGAASQTNQDIGANGFQASDGAKNNASAASGVGQLSAQADSSGTQAQSETFGAIVRRHAEKLKDHKSSVTGALQVQTEPCSGGGTATFAFDDASQSATEVFVNCSESGAVLHGTLSSSGVGVSQNLGQTPGSAYSISVTATFTIDLSATRTSPAPALAVVTQGSLTFTVGFSGTMQAAPNGGVQPGTPNRTQISMSGSSLLTSTTIGTSTFRSQLSNFSLSVDDNDTLGRTTVSGGYTFASTAINGSVTVNVTTPIVYQPQTSRRPSSGAVTITSSGSPGKIVVTVISSVAGVRVDVYANATDLAAVNTSNLTWAQVDPT